MNGPANNDWIHSTREPLEYRLDVGFQCPGYLPASLDSDDGHGKEPAVLPHLPEASGFVLSGDIEGREAELCAHYQSFSEAASVFSRNPCVRQFQCLNVDLFIQIAGEYPLHMQMFGRAAYGCKQLLSEFANLQEPSQELYDNLDQGWALRALSSADEVFTLEWNWEGPEDWEDQMRALRFSRRRLAEQAEAASSRLLAMHRLLVDCAGEDLWIVPGKSLVRDKRTALVRWFSSLW